MITYTLLINRERYHMWPEFFRRLSAYWAAFAASKFARACVGFLQPFTAPAAKLIEKPLPAMLVIVGFVTLISLWNPLGWILFGLAAAKGLYNVYDVVVNDAHYQLNRLERQPTEMPNDEAIDDPAAVVVQHQQQQPILAAQPQPLNYGAIIIPAIPVLNVVPANNNINNNDNSNINTNLPNNTFQLLEFLKNYFASFTHKKNKEDSTSCGNVSNAFAWGSSKLNNNCKIVTELTTISSESNKIVAGK